MMQFVLNVVAARPSVTSKYMEERRVLWLFANVYVSLLLQNLCVVILKYNPFLMLVSARNA